MSLFHPASGGGGASLGAKVGAGYKKQKGARGERLMCYPASSHHGSPASQNNKKKSRRREGGTDRRVQSVLAVVLGSFLGSQNEWSQTGERLRHLQKLMLREEKTERGRGGGGRKDRIISVNYTKRLKTLRGDYVIHACGSSSGRRV